MRVPGTRSAAKRGQDPDETEVLPERDSRDRTVKILVLACAVIIPTAIGGAVLALMAGEPEPLFIIGAAPGEIDAPPPRDETVATSGDVGATLAKESAQPAHIKAGSSEERPIDFAQASLSNVAAPGAFVPVMADAPQPPAGLSRETPVVATVNTRAVPAPIAKPAPKAASETAGVPRPLTRNLYLPAKPEGISTARVVITRTDTTTPSAEMETPSRPGHLGTPVKSEKTARVSPKAPQAAAEPQAAPPAPHTFTQQPVNPLARAFAELVGALAGPAGWAVQLAAPKSETEASRDVARLNAKYASALNSAVIGVQKAQVNGATVYRLRVVGLSEADAAALCTRVKGDGGDCFIAKDTASSPNKGGRRVSGVTELPEETKLGRYGLPPAVHVGA